MKMHSPGHSSAAWITSPRCRSRHPRQAARPTGIVEHLAALGDIRDAVLELHEHVGTVVDAQTVTGAQVLVDPDTHGAETVPLAVYIGSTVTEEAEPQNDHAATTPCAPQRPHTWRRPTGDVDDPYAWMRQVDDPELLAYLEAENAAAERFFAPHADTIETIFGEIRSRVQETDLSTPVEFGPWWYVTSTTEGQSYPVHHRGPTADRATEQVLLDENIEAHGSRVLRPRSVRRVDGSSLRGLVDGHHRRRALHVADPRPGHRR